MLNRKGQNTAEYAILIALIIAAAVGVQTYVKMSLQGKIHDALEHTGDNLTIGNKSFSFTKNLYEPAPINSTLSTVSERSYNESIGKRGSIERKDVTEESKIRAGGTETYRE
jgi:Flp pilus assembly pilin Flp